MRLRSALVAVVATVPLVLAGCSQGGPAPAPPPDSPAQQPPAPAPAPGGASADQVAWTNEFCGLVGGFAASQQQGPPVDKSSAEAYKASAVARFDSAARSANETLQGLRAMKPAPIPGAQGITDTFERGFVRALDVLNSAKAKAEQVDTSDKQAFTSGMVAVQQEVSKGQGINFAGGFAKLKDNEALNAAAAQAPACKALMKPAQPPQQPQPPQPRP